MQVQKQSQKPMQKQRTVELACTKAYCCGCKLFKVPELSPSLSLSLSLSICSPKNSYIKQGLSAPAVHTRFLITCTPAVSWGGGNRKRDNAVLTM